MRADRMCMRVSLLVTLVLAIPASLVHAQGEDVDGFEDVEDDVVVESAPAISAPAPAPAPAPTPAPEPAPATNAVTAGYSRGFFIKSEDGKFLLKPEARVQGRLETSYNRNEVDERDPIANFRIQRARFGIGGHAFSENLKYKFQAEFGRGAVTLKDYYIDYKLGDLHIRTGQYKRPFSRQQITSSGRQELVDRAITDRSFDTGRDIGIMLHNNYERSPELEWAVGVFNGQTADVAGRNYPNLLGPAVVARVGINRGGIAGYSEADLEGGPTRFAVAGSVLMDLAADDTAEGKLHAQLDFIMKNNGLSVTGGVYVAMQEDADGFFDQSRGPLGLHIQAGYMLGKSHQVAARYAAINTPGVDGDLLDQEIAVAYSIYEFKHNFKWQTDLGLLVPDGASAGDNIQVRSQLQLAF